jgi:hypothetical protein
MCSLGNYRVSSYSKAVSTETSNFPSGPKRCYAMQPPNQPPSQTPGSRPAEAIPISKGTRQAGPRDHTKLVNHACAACLFVSLPPGLSREPLFALHVRIRGPASTAATVRPHRWDLNTWNGDFVGTPYCMVLLLAMLIAFSTTRKARTGSLRCIGEKTE